VTASRAAVALALAFAPAAARAAAYTVTPAGDDRNPGTAAEPFATLQRAADVAAAGDIVTVEPGTYAGFSLGWDHPQDGRPDAPITFTARPGVVIDAKNAHTDDGIDLEGCSYVVVEGFEVVGMPRAGIRAVSSGANAIGVVIRGNDTHDNEVWGIFTSHVDSLLIEGNRATGSVEQHGIYVSNACVNPVVRGNELAGNAGAGLHMNGDASQGGAGVITGGLVEKNVIHDNGTKGGSGINCDGVQSSRIRNNLIYAEHANGISLYQGDAAGPATNNVVASNTIVVAPDGRWALNVQNGSTGNRVENNILLDENPLHGSIDIDAASLAAFASDYNVVVDRFTADDSALLSLDAWRAATNQDAHSLVAAPAALFVSAGGNDYHLSATSPAIGAGTATDAPSDDLEGQSRGGGVDIGAYERCDVCAVDAGAGGRSGSGADGSVTSDAMSSGGPGGGEGGTDAATDGGTDAATDGGAQSGCGCAMPSSGRSRSSVPAAFALLVALGFARRRR
jgi:MYXO-CTERM domain-containing protein